MVRSQMESAYVIDEDHISKFERNRRGQFFAVEVWVSTSTRAWRGTFSMEIHSLADMRILIPWLVSRRMSNFNAFHSAIS